MKYFQLIFKLLILLVTLCLSGLSVNAQLNTISPYSRFGIGELESQNSILGANISGTTATFSPFYSINHNNPASYSSLLYPVFQTGLGIKNFQLETTETKERNYLSKLNEISVGLPFNKGISVAFGLMPFSSVGYELSTRSNTLGEDTIASFLYSGDGGYTRGFLGVSYQKKYFKDHVVYNNTGIAVDTISHLNSSFSLGINGNLIFGSADYNRDVVYDDLFNSYHRLESTTVSVGDPSSTYGFLYKRNVKLNYESYKGAIKKVADWNLTLGGSYTPENTLSTTSTRFIQSAQYSSTANDLIPIDTIFYSGDIDGEIVLPAKLALGASLSIQNRNKREFQFSVEWKNQNWENYSNSLDDIADGQIYGNTNMYSVGFQFTPKPITEVDIPWYKTTLYQIGYRAGENYLYFDDEALAEERVSLGISIPILGSKTISRINLGMDFGTVGSTDNGLIKETSVNSYIGFSLMPDMKKNGWFRQSKYR